MRNLYFRCIIALFLISSFTNAQNEKGCGFIYAQDKLRKTFPDYDAKLKELENLDVNASAKTSAVTLTIPVVFHVLHLNGSENISDAQIQSAIDVLNIDFRKLNPDTTSIVTQFKPLAADVNVEFRLASLDPDGKCTNGITRHYDTKTNWDSDQDYYVYTWPREKYLNIYVVKSIAGGGAAAYTYLPGSAPAVMDAIVSLDDYVGKIGTSSPGRSRTLTHEVGHWLGLPHIWGSTNNPGVSCGDDGVGDTPITKGHSWCNLSNAIDCTPTVVENIQNYMEYSGCPRMFTTGQANKMNLVLSTFPERINLVSAANMTASGILNPNYNCPPKADFLANASTCEGNQVTFTDYSYNGTVTTWVWSSPGASNTSTLQNGVLTFTNAGLLPVKLKVGNSFGEDSTTKVNFITVMANNGATLNIAQDFETGSYPDNEWIATPPQYGSGFAQTSTVGASGQKCLYVNNYGDNPNEMVELFSPKFDLTNASGAQLSYKYAFAQKGNSADELKVYATTNCGQSWATIYTQAGSGLASTAAPVNTVAYIPQSSEFKTQLINLGFYEGSSNVHLKFVFISDPGGAGNNFYIDDINLTGTVGLEEHTFNSANLKLFPNPAQTQVSLLSSVPIKQVDIFDLPGKHIVCMPGSNSNEQIIAVSQLTKGVYLIKVTTNSGTAFKKLVKE